MSSILAVKICFLLFPFLRRGRWIWSLHGNSDEDDNDESLENKVSEQQHLCGDDVTTNHYGIMISGLFFVLLW